MWRLRDPVGALLGRLGFSWSHIGPSVAILVPLVALVVLLEAAVGHPGTILGQVESIDKALERGARSEQVADLFLSRQPFKTQRRQSETFFDPKLKL